MTQISEGLNTRKQCAFILNIPDIDKEHRSIESKLQMIPFFLDNDMALPQGPIAIADSTMRQAQQVVMNFARQFGQAMRDCDCPNVFGTRLGRCRVRRRCSSHQYGQNMLLIH